MAGGKLTPRQKMINLMYLVFIAMLAMNMSKEVLSAFGLMNEKFEASNTSSLKSNEQSLAALDLKAKENKGEFILVANNAFSAKVAAYCADIREDDILDMSAKDFTSITGEVTIFLNS